MKTFIGVGVSTASIESVAVNEAVEGALINLEGRVPHAIILHATTGKDFSVLTKETAARFPGVPLVGGSVSGIITRSDIYDGSGAVQMCFIYSDDFKMTPFLVEHINRDASIVASEASKQFPKSPSAIYLTIDGLNCPDASQLVKEIGRRTHNATIVGGASGESLTFKETYEFYAGRAYTGALVGLAFTGDIEIISGYSHGSIVTDREHLVTSTDGGNIHTIDNRPAVEFLRSSAPNQPSPVELDAAHAISLGVFRAGETGDAQLALRAILGINPDGGVKTASSWHINQSLFVCIRSVWRMVERAKYIAESIRVRTNGREVAAILNVECVGRSPFLVGIENATSIRKANTDAFSESIPWFGYYGYGELCSQGGEAEYHNWTGVIVAICIGKRNKFLTFIDSIKRAFN